MIDAEQSAGRVGCFVIAIGVALVFFLLSLDNCEKEEACEKRGGNWYCAYKSQCVCLAKGTVVE